MWELPVAEGPALPGTSPASVGLLGVDSTNYRSPCALRCCYVAIYRAQGNKRSWQAQRQEITCAGDRRSHLSDEQEILQSAFLGIGLLRDHDRIARRQRTP